MTRFVAVQKRSHRLQHGGWLEGHELWEEFDRLGFEYTLLTSPVDDEGIDAKYLVFEADRREVADSLRDGSPVLWIEREIIYRTAQRLTVNVRTIGDAPIAGSTVAAVLTSEGVTGKLSAVTGDDGAATFDFDHTTTFHRFEVHKSGHWPMIDLEAVDGMTMTCPPLPMTPDGLGWWHRAVGIDRLDLTRGRGIRVGVVDTAVGEHSALDHVHRIGGWNNNLAFEPRSASGHFHGTHVCGIIGGRPTGQGYAGMAPAAELFAASVPERPNQAAVARAILTLVENHQVQLINVSMEGDTLSHALKDAIEEALDRGCLIFAAVGNLGTQYNVRYPARHKQVIGVSALGKVGEYPSDSVCQWYESESEIASDHFFFAIFSCTGERVDCCAPGVGIISAAPPEMSDSWGCEDGTSMASPLACGVLAAILSRRRSFLYAEPTRERAIKARRIFRRACHPVGWDSALEGHGVPRV